MNFMKKPHNLQLTRPNQILWSHSLSANEQLEPCFINTLPLDNESLKTVML